MYNIFELYGNLYNMKMIKYNFISRNHFSYKLIILKEERTNSNTNDRFVNWQLI